MCENVNVPIRVATETVNEETLALINRIALEPVTMDEIFTFSGVCSNDRMDSYLTKMDPVTTLRNYAANLKKGVSLLPGHDISKSPYGRSYDGELITPDMENENNSVRGHWYILKDTVINGENTNDTIRQIKAGILRDMSVGFGGNSMWYRCSSCGRDITDWDCPHFPGLEDENGRMTYAWIMEAELREVSTVYKGSTPGAFIDKARSYVGQGELENKAIARLEREYQVRFERNDKRSFFMPKPKEGTSLNFLDELRTQIRENKIEKGKIYDLLTEEGEPFRQPDDIALRNELGKDFTSVEAVRQLKKEAQQGRRYLADSVDLAVSARVKAQGDTFNAESYRSMLVTWGDIDAIKEEAESYNKAAEQRFSGGRQTEPTDPQPKDPEPVVKTVRVDNDKINFFDGSDE
ncbi:hypothetical protein [Peribacillus asahii]|uniref:hypothetical protein n=1 Tax=Peribacillus asahii TaxID=228899 RepID=UPI00207A8C63|nr:hypothetical protein [Peribacillus asahii]USK72672.1 hypothetical protein LIS76_23405 [Peribacillus asahii]USK72709.1 hypothetical protein LIS76_23985 [Peribacillus asahii]